MMRLQIKMIKEKSTHSTPQSEAWGMLRIDTAIR
jgi:hypothetical protein